MLKLALYAAFVEKIVLPGNGKALWEIKVPGIRNSVFQITFYFDFVFRRISFSQSFCCSF